MGLLMYRGSSPTPTVAGKPDPTAAARSPIRRAPSRSLSTRSQRRQSTNAESLFLSSQSSPQLTPRDGSLEPYSVPGNYTASLSPVDLPVPEQPTAFQPLRDEPTTDTLPFVQHTSTIAHHPDAPASRDSPRTASDPSAESPRRMQVTRQRPTRRASLEADMGRFVVRPILSEEEVGADAAPSPTVDPMELLIVSEPAAPPATRRQRRRRSLPWQGLERVRPRERARSRSPHRRSAAPRIAPPGPTDGLGDRRRSPSVEVEESDWETLRATIQPDAQLPSASSSFTSASASSNSSDAQTASAPSSATTSAASSFITNHRYVLPTEECLDITTAQRECGVVCDDARDAQPPFRTSRGPSRHPTREPSADRPRTRRHGTRPTVDSPFVDDAPGRSPHPLAIAAAAAAARDARAEANADATPSDAGSTAPVHLHLPTPSEIELFDTHFRAMLRAQGARSPLDASPRLRPRPVAESPPPEPIENEQEDENEQHTAPTRLGQRLAEVQQQWTQLRRINELLRCGREVPGWLWEVAGLAPELQVREFEL